MSTTESVTTAENEFDEGTQVKGTNLIYLNAPKVYLSEETPLLAEAQDIAGAINELKKLSAEGGGDEDWQPPADWLEVPEPGPWEANFLIELHENLYFQFWFLDPVGSGGTKYPTVDWGDGSITEKDTYMSHTYETGGQYVIKVTTDETCCLFIGFQNSTPMESILIAKLGENILLEKSAGKANAYPNNRAFGGCVMIKSISIQGNTNLPESAFSGCYTLKKINFAKGINNIPKNCFYQCNLLNTINGDFSNVNIISEYAFAYCYCLKYISLLNCAEISKNAFQSNYSLAEISAPLCTSIGNYAFYQCYNLETATFANDCTFGTNAFNYCYNLYPRPDGSTN